MSTLAIWCRIVQSRDVRSRVFSRLALSHSASNALDSPNTAETNASSIGDGSRRCWLLDHAGGCSLRSRRSDQSRRTRDDRTYQAVFLARRVGGGWPNEGAVKTLMQRHKELERDPICHIEPVQLSMTELSQAAVVFQCAAHHSRCSVHDSL